MPSARAKPRYIHRKGATAEEAPLAAVAGDLIFYGGGMAVDGVSGVPEGIAALDGYPHHWSRINRELRHIFSVAGEVLGEAGSSLADVLKINSFHTAAEDTYEALRLRPELFGDEPPPSTLVLVPELAVRNACAAVDFIALKSDASMARRAVFSSTAAAPMPPHERIWGRRIYSKAASGGGFVFTSGRTNNVIGGADDATARGVADLPHRGDRAVETCRMILGYLKDVLATFGAGFGDVVRAEIHLSDMNQIAGIDHVWRDAFPEAPPARIFVPAGFPTTYTTMEIELIARDPAGPWDIETVADDLRLPAHGHEPAAVRAGPYLFFSGLSASDGINGLSPAAAVNPAYPFHENPLVKQADYIVNRVKAIGGSAMSPLRQRLMGPSLEAFGAAAIALREGLGTEAPTTAFRTPASLPTPSTALQIDLIGTVD